MSASSFDVRWSFSSDRDTAGPGPRAEVWKEKMGFVRGLSLDMGEHASLDIQCDDIPPVIVSLRYATEEEKQSYNLIQG